MEVPNKIPKSIISQLNEHSSGGFVLFASDSEGSVSCYSHFDTNLYALALSSYIKNWSEAIEQVSVDNLISSINEKIDPEEDEDDKIE